MLDVMEEKEVAAIGMYQLEDVAQFAVSSILRFLFLKPFLKLRLKYKNDTRK